MSESEMEFYSKTISAGQRLILGSGGSWEVMLGCMVLERTGEQRREEFSPEIHPKIKTRCQCQENDFWPWFSLRVKLPLFQICAGRQEGERLRWWIHLSLCQWHMLLSCARVLGPGLSIYEVCCCFGFPCVFYQHLWKEYFQIIFPWPIPPV